MENCWIDTPVRLCGNKIISYQCAGTQKMFNKCSALVAHQLFVEKKDRMLVSECEECSGDIFLLTCCSLLTALHVIL